MNIYTVFFKTRQARISHSGLTTYLILFTWSDQHFAIGATRPFPPPITILYSAGTNAYLQKDKKRLIRCKIDDLVSFTTGSKAFWYPTKAVFQNFYHSNFPYIYNVFGGLIFEPREKAEGFSRLHPLPLDSVILLLRVLLFPLASLLHFSSTPEWHAKTNALWTCPNHPVRMHSVCLP